MFLQRADMLLQQGRPKEAEEWVKKALETDPQDDHALSVLARCYFNSRQLDKGIATIQQAIAIDPDEPHYFYLLGFGHYQKNQFPQAINHLTKAIQLYPYNAEYYGLMAFIYLEQLDFKQALFKADEGLAIDAENITCLNARSTAQNKLKLTDDAIATMENALSKDPDNEFTHATIGWNYLEKGKHKLATQHFREALRIAPGHHSAKLGLKEALKSKIPPYRWLLQFSFWMKNKGKNFRIGFVIAIFIGVRLIVSLSKESPGMENIAMIVAGAYFVFVATSWIINPLANVFLLFHKDGKHALESSERWNAIAFMICVFSGLAVMSLAALADTDQQSDFYLGAGLVALSLCIPAGHMQYPIRLRGNSFSQWLAISALLLAIITVGVALAGLPGINVLFILYAMAFIGYTWTTSF